MIDYRAEIKALIDGIEGTAGLYIQSMDGRIRLTLNPDLTFPAASLIKLPIFHEYSNRVRSGGLDPARKITLSKNSIVGGHGILKTEPLNSTHALNEIAELMITLSDNTAANILIDILGMDRINDAAQTLGMKNAVLQRKMMDFDSLAEGKDNRTTPRDISLFLGELLHTRVISPEMGQEMRGALKRQAVRNKLPALLPPSTVIAHKTGALDGAEHDAGIVFSASGRCIIVVLTKDLASNDDGVSFCRKIGRLIFDVMSNGDRV